MTHRSSNGRGLYERTSAKGEIYLVGYIAGLKILCLRNKNAGADEPGWNLCVTARPEKQAGRRVGTGPKSAPSRPIAPREMAERIDRDLDDEVPWLG
jgi:hypothetical protein